MRSFIKTITMVIIFVLSITLFYGCGSSKTAGNVSSKAATFGRKAKGDSEAQQADSRVVLKYWSDNGYENFFKPLIEAFNARYPNISVEMNFYTKEVDLNSQNPLIIALAAGEEIDLFNADNNVYLAYYSSKNVSLDISDLLKRDNFDVTPYGPLFEKQKIDGKSVGLPMRKTFWALYYNKDIFTKANVPFPKDAMKWSEFRELAKKLTTGSGNDKIYGTFNDTWGISTFSQAAQAGLSIDAPDNEEALKNSMDFWRGLWVEDKSLKSWADIKAQKTWTLPEFMSGKVAMVIHGEWLPAAINKDKKEGKTTINYDVVLPPVNNGVEPGTTWSMPMDVIINSKTQNVDAAWELMKFLCGREGAEIVAKGGSLPAYNTPETTKLFIAALEGEPANMENVLARIIPMPEYGMSVNLASISKAFDEENELVQLGEKSPEDAIAAFKKKVADIK